jgi:hypothetical protein
MIIGESLSLDLNEFFVRRGGGNSTLFGLTLEKWAYLATAISALTAVIFVAFGVYQLIKLRAQVILTSDSVEAAKRAADAAQEAARETGRVRIDEQAPRVLTVMEHAQWPPRISRSLTHMPNANEPRMFDSQTLHGAPAAGGDDFIFPEAEQRLLWFILRGVLINEGHSTARVRLDGEARFIEGESTLVPDRKILCPPIVGSPQGVAYIGREHLLRPGEIALFEWAEGYQLKEWAARHDQADIPHNNLQVTVFDSTEYGVLDRTKVELSGRPLEPVPNRQGHWQITSERHVSVNVWPAQREYRSENHFRQHP